MKNSNDNGRTERALQKLIESEKRYGEVNSLGEFLKLVQKSRKRYVATDYFSTFADILTEAEKNGRAEISQLIIECVTNNKLLQEEKDFYGYVYNELAKRTGVKSDRRMGFLKGTLPKEVLRYVEFKRVKEEKAGR